MVFGIACSSGTPQANQQTPKPIDCGAVTSLTMNAAVGGVPTPGVLLGPLFFDAFEKRADSAAVLSDFSPGYPYKVLIQPVEAFSTPVQVQGWSCSNGSGLRFWYHEGPPFATVPVTAQQLAFTGDLVASLGPTLSSLSGTLAGFTGYMMFTATGKWKISVSKDGRNLGSAIFLVAVHA
jgi:hypothetical protein